MESVFSSDSVALQGLKTFVSLGVWVGGGWLLGQVDGVTGWENWREGEGWKGGWLSG